ncbi:rho GTPase-activating protein gacV-like [Microplitis demolitor]|uniref:rho GTPase-activating protein gacV-like n=1 Tax=Microplitis demolitor TaxID=69319 RepID=UPI00235B5D4B|nr:rho GTPase-activating protein gacV-like [Microplitis demolitor]
MALILDIQGFTTDNNFIVKELSTISIHDDNLVDATCLLFKSPFDQEDLTDSEKRQNDWLTDYHHGLAWNSGIIPYENAKNILTIILQNITYIYVKGAMKKNWLDSVLDDKKPIIDLEDHDELLQLDDSSNSNIETDDLVTQMARLWLGYYPGCETIRIDHFTGVQRERKLSTSSEDSYVSFPTDNKESNDPGEFNSEKELMVERTQQYYDNCVTDEDEEKDEEEREEEGEEEVEEEEEEEEEVVEEEDNPQYT